MQDFFNPPEIDIHNTDTAERALCSLNPPFV